MNTIACTANTGSFPTMRKPRAVPAIPKMYVPEVKPMN
jgi:hypothetical protein